MICRCNPTQSFKHVCEWVWVCMEGCGCDLLKHSDFSEKDNKSIQRRKINNEDTYPILFECKLKNIQWFHIPKQLQMSIIHSSSNTHSSVNLTVSPSLLLIHSLFFISLNSHFCYSHQLLHPKVTAHTQYVLQLLPYVMESKIKRFQISSLKFPPKYTSWKTKSKSHQNIPMNLWDSNLSKQTLSLSYLLPLSDLWGVGVKL